MARFSGMGRRAFFLWGYGDDGRISQSGLSE
jgi:hypothetical protein